MVASMLDLPRELYLMLCDYLSPTDLARLAGMSKDYYMSVQEPLFAHIDISSFGKLVKLVGTITKPPVISKISARQRLRWQSLSDHQLRERDVKRLNILLDNDGESKSSKPINGELLSRCVGAISRSRRGVRICLALQGRWHHLLSQLRTVALPDVRELVLYLGGVGDTAARQHPSGPRAALSPWELLFSGSAFPDLEVIEFDAYHASRKQLPASIDESMWFDSSQNFAPEYDAHSLRDYKFPPLSGLKKMKRIKLQYNNNLGPVPLASLFGSNVTTQNLTSLDIVPSLQQTDYAALSMLLQRGLQLLQHLKLHLQPEPRLDMMRYCNEIEENPNHHLCNVIRELGETITSLDIALPLVCSHIFVPLPKAGQMPDRRQLGLPHISRQPEETLPARLRAAGYRYRRLICWNGSCQGKFESMQDLASRQGELISWELVSAPDRCGSWHLSGCLPVHHSSKDVLLRQLAEEER